jgi:hypothetical protein
MYAVRQHYDRIAAQLERTESLDLSTTPHLRVIVPIQRWNALANAALCSAFSISSDIHVLFISGDDEEHENFSKHWKQAVVDPARAANRPVPELVCIESPYRFVVTPIVDYVLETAAKHHDCRIVAIVPEIVERRWYNYFLHSQRAMLLKTMLLRKGTNQISVLNVSWYVE